MFLCLLGYVGGPPIGPMDPMAETQQQAETISSFCILCLGMLLQDWQVQVIRLLR